VLARAPAHDHGDAQALHVRTAPRRS
jgi:hypothetical protein